MAVWKRLQREGLVYTRDFIMTICISDHRRTVASETVEGGGGRQPRRQRSVRLSYVKAPGWHWSKFLPWRPDTTSTFMIELMDQTWTTPIHVIEYEYHYLSCNTLKLETAEPYIKHCTRTCSMQFTDDPITNTTITSAVIQRAAWTQKSTDDLNTISLIPILTELHTTKNWLRERLRG